MIRSIVLCLVMITSVAAEETFDQIVRYVNDTPISQQDIFGRAMYHFVRLREAGETSIDRSELYRIALDELTDEQLLLQEANRLGVVIDNESVNEAVWQRMEETGRGYNIEEFAAAHRQYIRQQTVRAVIRFYRQGVEDPTPAELRQAYLANIDEFTSPPQVRILRIALAPPALVAGDDDELEAEARGIFRGVQRDPTPAINQVVSEDVLRRYIEDRDGRSALLQSVVIDVAAVDLPADAPTASQRLHAAATELAARYQVASGPDDRRERLAAMRAEILALERPEERRERFMALARAHSQGPNASEGGDLGMQDVEPDDPFLQAPLHEPSEIFAMENGGIMFVMIVESLPAQRASFGEALAEITQSILEERGQAAIETMMSRLYQQAVIHDIIDVANLRG